MDRGVWQAIVHGVANSDMTKYSTAHHSVCIQIDVSTYNQPLNFQRRIITVLYDSINCMLHSYLTFVGHLLYVKPVLLHEIFGP